MWLYEYNFKVILRINLKVIVKHLAPEVDWCPHGH
jgi:hypothetical protein